MSAPASRATSGPPRTAGPSVSSPLTAPLTSPVWPPPARTRAWAGVAWLPPVRSSDITPSVPVLLDTRGTLSSSAPLHHQ